MALCLAVIGAPSGLRSQESPDSPLASVTLPPALDRVLRDYERAWRAGDEAALALLFTEDGHVPTGSGWVRGRAAIERHYAGADGDLHLRGIGFAIADTVGYIIGAYRWGSDMPDRGKFILALRHVGDRWLIAADLDSSNR